jgi:hypothetical protein
VSEIRLIETRIPELLPMLDRSKGVHISDIIHRLSVAAGRYRARTAVEAKGEFSDDVRLRMELECALEHAIVARFAAQYPDRFVQPGELEDDGLYGTPDLLDVETLTVDEVKLTWMSSREPDSERGDSEKLWGYWVQVMAYCRMLRTRLGRLRVVFVNGNYRYSEMSCAMCGVAWDSEAGDSEAARARGACSECSGTVMTSGAPQYRVWEREFTQQELDTNWRMLLSGAEGL